LPGVEAGQVRAVHHARVASRRLREVLPMLQLDPETSRKLIERLRRVTRRLGRIRELDVLLQFIGDFKRRKLFPERALDYLAVDVREARDKRLEKTTHKRAMSELKRVSRKLEKVLRRLDARSSQPNDRAWRWALEARAARRAAALDKAIAKAGSLYLSDRLHDVRIAVKKLRYAYELVVEASGEQGAADLRTLKRSQQLLGRIHDLDVLIARARRAQSALAPAEAQLGKDLDVIVLGLDRDCRRLHGRYVRDRRALSAITHRLIARSLPGKASTLRQAG
jgi:CHAD domain-containing protein